MGSSNATPLAPPHVHYHNVLFLEERAPTARITAFHFHGGEYECFSVLKSAMPPTPVTLGYTTLTFDEVDGAMRDERRRLGAVQHGCWPPLCWTASKLRDMGVPVLCDIDQREAAWRDYNVLYGATVATGHASSAYKRLVNESCSSS
jgi:hypothetical protein